MYTEKQKHLKVVRILSDILLFFFINMKCQCEKPVVQLDSYHDLDTTDREFVRY